MESLPGVDVFIPPVVSGWVVAGRHQPTVMPQPVDGNPVRRQVHRKVAASKYLPGAVLCMGLSLCSGRELPKHSVNMSLPQDHSQFASESSVSGGVHREACLSV